MGGLCILDGMIKNEQHTGEGFRRLVSPVIGADMNRWRKLGKLPGKCRPNKRLVFNVNNHARSSRVDVEPNGIITWHAGGKDHGWLSLSGIKFATGAAEEAPATGGDGASPGKAIGLPWS